MHWSLQQFMMVILMAGVVCKLDTMFEKYKWPKWIKWCLFMVSLFMVGFSAERGWPARNVDIDEFIYISGVVQPPTDVSDGKIFIWVRLEEDPSKPYAIELDYDDELAKKVNIANLQSIISGEMSVDMRQFKEVKAKKVHVTEI